MNRMFARVYALLFCLVIAAPSSFLASQKLGLINTSASHSLEGEKRTLNAWPSGDYSYKNFDDYAAAVNLYLEDRLSFRDTFIKLTTELRYKLLGLSSSRDALFGQQGWLFLTHTVENAIGSLDVSDEHLMTWADNAQAIKQRVEQNGGVFLLLVPPDKAQVYPEHLPSQMRHKPSARLIDRLKPLLDERGVETLDLLAELNHLKAQAPNPLLYSKTDTHWTHKGALHGYKKAIKALRAKGLSLPIASENQLKKIEQENFIGDLAGLLNLKKYFSEPLELLLANQSFKHLSPTQSLLIYGDSFNGRLVDFWRYSFKDFHCYHNNAGHPDLSLLDQVKTDVVILQVIERNLAFPLTLNGTVRNPCF